MSLTVPRAFDEAPSANTLVRAVILAAMSPVSSTPDALQAHFLNEYPALVQLEPWAAIRLMIELRDEHFIARV